MTHLDHIGVAVKEIEAAKRIYKTLGIEFSESVEEVISEKVKVSFGKVDENASIELLEPTSEDSSIAKFIEKKGQGIHHLCFRVEDIEIKAKELQEQGYSLLYDGPRKGAHNCLVNFIHPKSAGGVLIEISQKIEG